MAFGVCYWAIIGALNSSLCGQCCCCCSTARLCLTLCNSMDCSQPDFLVLHYLPEFAQAHVYWVGDTIQCLILCGQCNLFITWGKIQELSERSSCYGERILKMGLGKYYYHHVTFFFFWGQWFKWITSKDFHIFILKKLGNNILVSLKILSRRVAEHFEPICWKQKNAAPSG